VILPASNLEGMVIDRLRAFLDDPAALLDVLADESHGSGRTELIERSHQVAEELRAQAPTLVKALLMRLLCRVAVKSNRVEINLSRSRVERLVKRWKIQS
jgi:site-specific DNA recombinase